MTNVPLLPSPVGHTFEDWVGMLNQTQIDFDVLPQNVYSSWEETANVILQSEVCRTANCPFPENFATWQDWAERFVQSFGGVR